MVQSLDFAIWTQKHPYDKKRILDALSSGEPSEIIIDRHKLSFDPGMNAVTIDRASEEVPFACKIIKCRMPYGLLSRILEGNWDDMTGLEFL